jgi:hypothetical protein
MCYVHIYVHTSCKQDQGPGNSAICATLFIMMIVFRTGVQYWIPCVVVACETGIYIYNIHMCFPGFPLLAANWWRFDQLLNTVFLTAYILVPRCQAEIMWPDLLLAGLWVGLESFYSCRMFIPVKPLDYVWAYFRGRFKKLVSINKNARNWRKDNLVCSCLIFYQVDCLGISRAFMLSISLACTRFLASFPPIHHCLCELQPVVLESL